MGDADPLAAKRRALIESWDAGWSRLAAVCGRIADADAARPGTSGEWSAKDVFAHVARWHAATVEVVSGHLAGSDSDAYDDFETLNRRWAAEDARLTPAQARERMEATHRSMWEYVAGLRPEQWDAFVYGWVQEAGPDHYALHLADLERLPAR